MLMLARHVNESILIRLADGVDPSTPVGEIFDQPIEIEVSEIRSRDQVLLGINAPPELNVIRDELEENNDD